MAGIWDGSGDNAGGALSFLLPRGTRHAGGGRGGGSAGGPPAAEDVVRVRVPALAHAALQLSPRARESTARVEGAVKVVALMVLAGVVVAGCVVLVATAVQGAFKFRVAVVAPGRGGGGIWGGAPS